MFVARMKRVKIKNKNKSLEMKQVPIKLYVSSALLQWGKNPRVQGFLANDNIGENRSGRSTTVNNPMRT